MTIQYICKWLPDWRRFQHIFYYKGYECSVLSKSSDYPKKKDIEEKLRRRADLDESYNY